MAKKRLCIWDWNGTIQDDAHHIYECGVQRIFRHFGLPCPTLDEYKDEVKTDFMSSFYWPRGIPANVTREKLNAIMSEGFKEKGHPAHVFPDAIEVVKEIHGRGYELMLVSGYQSDKLVAAVERSGLTRFFTLIRGDVGEKVSKIDAFGECIALVGPAAGPVSAIGDTVEDAVAAHAVGATPFICPRGFHTRERLEAARADAPSMVIVETLSDILAYLP